MNNQSNIINRYEMTRTGKAARPDLEERALSIKDWAELHRKAIGIAAIIIAALAAGGWLYTQQRSTRETNAYKSLSAAQQSFASGNIPLAQRDLESLVRRYSGTSSAREARILLAHIFYDQRQFQKGIAQLDTVLKEADEASAAGVEDLIGDGYEEIGKYDDAAAHYRRAAEKAPFPALRAAHLTDAARALETGGKAAEALKIWNELGKDPTSPMAAEARVRIGELQARPATRS